MMRLIALLFALFLVTPLSAEATCPEGEVGITYMELKKYDSIPGVDDHWGFEMRITGGNGTVGSVVPEWELDAIRQSLDLATIPDLIGKGFCVRGDVSRNLAINALAVRFLAERNGTTYTAPTAEELIERIANSLVAGEQPDLKGIAKIDQLRLAKELFEGGFAKRELRPEVFKSLKRKVEAKSEGALMVINANREDFRFTSTCLCGNAYLATLNAQAGDVQLFAIGELLPIVMLDPGVRDAPIITE